MADQKCYLTCELTVTVLVLCYIIGVTWMYLNICFKLCKYITTVLGTSTFSVHLENKVIDVNKSFFLFYFFKYVLFNGKVCCLD